MNPEHKKISKFLSYILRHHPETIGLTLDSEGWAGVDELIARAQAHHRPLTRSLLEDIVATNDKKRFTLSEDRSRIRAAQGHSTAQVTIAHAPQIPPAILYHGTAARFLESIRTHGLLPGSRHHVHLSADHATAVKVGSRHGKPVVLEINAAAMQQHGLPFYLSDNHVWLTEHVPPQFLHFPD